MMQVLGMTTNIQACKVSPHLIVAKGPKGLLSPWSVASPPMPLKRLSASVKQISLRDAPTRGSQDPY